MRQTPKYFVNAASAIKTRRRRQPAGNRLRASPSNHNAAAQTQNASIITSHITVVLEIRKTGVNKVASAASIGWLQK